MPDHGRIAFRNRLEETRPVSDLEPDRRAILRQEIVTRQSELEDAILDLRSVVERGMAKVDIRRRVVASPWAWLGGGFAVGLMLGLRRR